FLETASLRGYVKDSLRVTRSASGNLAPAPASDSSCIPPILTRGAVLTDGPDVFSDTQKYSQIPGSHQPMASEDLAALREDLVECVAEVRRPVCSFGTHLHDVLFPALQDLFPKVLAEGACGKAPLPPILMIGHDIRNQRPREPFRPLVRVLRTEDRGRPARRGRRSGDRAGRGRPRSRRRARRGRGGRAGHRRLRPGTGRHVRGAGNHAGTRRTRRAHRTGERAGGGRVDAERPLAARAAGIDSTRRNARRIDPVRGIAERAANVHGWFNSLASPLSGSLLPAGTSGGGSRRRSTA